MLSTPMTNLQAAQRQHRRQQSTPTAFDGAKAPALPNTIHQHRQPAGHRRGLSLDVRRRQPNPIPARQDYRLSIGANMGVVAASSHHQQQQVLREAQQRRLQARQAPQQQQQQQHHPHFASLAHGDDDTYLISPHGTPHNQRFDPSCFNPAGTMPFDSFGAPMNIMVPKDPLGYLDNMPGSAKDFELFAASSSQPTPSFMNPPESPVGSGWVSEGDTSSSRRGSRRISNGIIDRVAKYENMGLEDLQRPSTPTSQNGSDYFPPTPLGTPHGREIKQEQSRPSRFLGDYDESMEETIKPTRKRQTQAAPNIFDDMRHRAEQSIPTMSTSCPSTAPEHQGFANVHMQMPDYMNMVGFKDALLRMQNRYDGIPAPPCVLPGASGLNQHMLANMDQPIGGFDGHPQAQQLHNDSQSETDSPSRVSRHRRTDSMASIASIASAASIANINIEETRTETGVTLEEIAQYIRSPDTTDGKWTCLFEECGKQFGRKENIKSHVQTHLNDRQYQCPTCHKCFVRQHDLKRHAKIHTGIKPYPCECGNSFARHDALTRHRQRGMCIGAFDGVVRKVVKRGRPKKNRPEMDSRLEKATKTRKKNASISSISSQSGYSDCSSVVDSPVNDHDMFDDMLDMGLDTDVQELRSLSSAPMPSVVSRTLSGYASSPAVSTHSFVTADGIMDKVSRPGSPAKSGTSQYNTPPELSQSSSSPPARFFDLDPNATSAGTDNLASMTTAGVTMTSAVMNGTLSMGMNEQDDELLLQFREDEGLVQTDRDSMMMMPKYDEEFDTVGSMFASNDDVFFGGP